MAGDEFDLRGKNARRTQEALLLFEKPMRLNPPPPPFYFLNFGHAYRILGSFEEAVTSIERPSP